MSLSRVMVSVTKLGYNYFAPISSQCHSRAYLQRANFVKNSLVPCRNLFTNVPRRQEEASDEVIKKTEDSAIDPKIVPIVPVEKSIKYLNSAAYKETYGVYPVWNQYRRNHKGIFAPRKTRKTCIRSGKISTGNPCPICRDEFLVLDHRNTQLLKQFVSPHNGAVLSYTKTGLCQKRHEQLLVEVERAYDLGLLTFDVPFREYDYSQYTSQLS